ncbi:hypothetical protein [Parapedobacter sp.]
MANRKMTHELEQLAEMFCQLGQATAQIVGGGAQGAEAKTLRRSGVQKPEQDESAASVYRVIDEIETV